MRKSIIIPIVLVLFTLASTAQERSIKIRVVSKEGISIDLYSKSYALVIGVSDYTGGWPDLPNAADDAREVGQELQKHGFTVFTLENPTSTQLKNGIETFIASYGLDPDSRILLFFAGHGHTIKKSYGGNVGYIVPADAPDPGVDMSGFLRNAISMERFNTYARDINAKHALYLFDSCFSGSIFALSRAVPEAISYKTSQHVRQFITAGGEDEQVPDRSVFKSQLISAIRGEADKDQDGYVTGTELGMFLQYQVVNYTRGSQHPQYGKIRDPQLDKGDFVFVTGPAQPPPVVIPDLPEDKPGVDISKYKAERDRLATAKKRWADWQLKMNNDYNEINSLDRDENLTAASKIKAWSDFISAYTENNPYSNDDENLRSKAHSRKDHWSSYRLPVTVSRPAASNDMVFVPAGSFMMGSNEGDSDEKPIHHVYMDGFYMDKYEVTVAQFRAFCNETGRKMPDQPAWNEDDHPVVNVTWDDAAAYAEWAGKRLPTEAEWEYAAREGGKDVRFGNGKDIADPNEINFDGRSQYKKSYSISGVYCERTTPVASFAPNALGMYDMSGNVWEWCADWYDENYYKKSPERNPKGPSSGQLRVLRGGSWGSEPRGLRCADRYGYSPVNWYYFLGFRCVRTL